MVGLENRRVWDVEEYDRQVGSEKSNLKENLGCYCTAATVFFFFFVDTGFFRTVKRLPSFTPKWSGRDIFFATDIAVGENSSKNHLHYGSKQPRIQNEVLGHSLVCSLVCSHRSLVGEWIIRWLFCPCSFPFSTIVIWWPTFRWKRRGWIPRNARRTWNAWSACAETWPCSRPDPRALPLPPTPVGSDAPCPRSRKPLPPVGRRGWYTVSF